MGARASLPTITLTIDPEQVYNRDCTPTPEQLAKWVQQKGVPVEALVRSGAIRLLNARWLVSYAKSKRALPPRQMLPEAAFVTIAQLQLAQPRLSDYLRVVVLSHAWLSPSHPDPKAHTLCRLAQLLEVMLDHTWRSEIMFRFVGVFWDWGSLHQHAGGRLQRNLVRRRSAVEERHFRHALNSLALLYAHPFTYVVRATSLPVGYPDGYRLPAGHPATPYDERGWCVTETAWATMVKSGKGVIDLALFRPEAHADWRKLLDDCAYAVRKPPLLPCDFEQLVATKRFTNGKEDQPLVCRLYRTYFEEAIAQAEALKFGQLEWRDADVTQLVAVALSPMGMPCMRQLWLDRNRFTDEGCHSLARMLDAGGMPELEELYASDNEFKTWGAGASALRASAERRGVALYMD